MTTDLKKRAEVFLATNPEETPTVSTADVKRLVHALAVHQVELEMQNEALRAAQTELAHSRDSYAGLYDFAPVGYLTLDRDGVILEANHTAATMLGVARGKLLHRTFTDLVVLDDRDDWFRHWRQVSADDEKHCVDLDLAAAGGTSFTARLESRLRPGRIENDWRCLMVLSDVTVRVQAETALHRFNETLERRVEERTADLAELENRTSSLLRFRNEMLDTTAIWIDTLDSRGNVTLWNRAAEWISGYKRDEVLGHAKVWEWLYPEPGYRRQVLAMVMAVIQEGRRVENFETVIRRKDGEQRVISWHSNNLCGDSGEVLGSVALGADVTARKRAEEFRVKQQKQLRDLAARLASAQDDEQRRIAEGLHEDVAQLLSACSVKIAVADKAGSLVEIRQLHDEIDALLREAGEKVRSLSFELASSTLHSLGLWEAVHELCENMSSRYGVQFELEGAGRAAKLDEASATVLFKATRELLFNVVKHAHVKMATVTISGDVGNLRLMVEDHGTGFPRLPEVVDIDEGKGLGLFGIRERLKDLGGKMQIDSQPNVRTCVTLTVPVGGGSRGTRRVRQGH